MKTIITQNGETRECILKLGQCVKHPKGFWGFIRMFGEDDKQRPRILMDRVGFSISKKYGVYPHELQLQYEDFNKGEIIEP